MLRARSSATSRFQILTFIGLITFGFIGNYFYFPMFFGVDYLFGSIATLLAIALLGPRPAVVIAVITSAYTFWLWNHPYAALILVGEALFVSLIWSRLGYNLILVVSAYWLFIGAPAVLVLYYAALGMPWDSAVLAAVKQGTNGMLNAIIANFLLAYTPLVKHSRAPESYQRSLFQTVFTLFVGAAIIPAFVILAFEARQIVIRVEDTVLAQLRTISTAISLSTEQWLKQHESKLRLTAVTAAEFSTANGAQLQHFVNRVKINSPAFSAIFITDETGVARIYSPLISPAGEPTIGVDYSDREYFTKLKSGAADFVVTQAFKGKRFGAVAVLATSIPVEGKFKGIVVGALNLSRLADILTSVPEPVAYKATLVDDRGVIISSNDPDLRPLENYEEKVKGDLQGRNGDTFQRWPNEKSLPPMTKWVRSRIGRSVPIAGTTNWRLIVEVPTAASQYILFRQYVSNMGILFMLFLAVLICSHWLARKITAPLVHLSNETTNLTERLRSGAEVNWPEGKFFEIEALGRNFQAMTLNLRRRFQELDRVNANLKEKSRIATLVNEVGLSLQSALDLEKIGQAVIDSSTQLSGAGWGVFCCVLADERGNLHTINATSGISKEAIPENRSIEFPRKTIRFDNWRISESIRPPIAQEYLGKLRSFLAVPLMSRSGEPIGGLYFGHPEPGKFTDANENFVAGVAAQAAVAIDNAALYTQAQVANRIKDEFLATLSHELRTPLNVILGHADIIRSGELSEREMQASVEAIQRNASAQNQLIADLLDISAIVTGKFAFTPSRIQLVAAVQSAIDSISLQTKAKNIDLSFKVLSDECSIIGDPTRIQQVIWNLLSNAVKFTAPEGRITVMVRHDGENAFLEVADSGRGIESKFLPHVFDRFRQEDSSMTRHYGGLGLGLSIVRHLVELHGGSIRATSGGKDKGSTFTVRLPLATQALPSLPKKPALKDPEKIKGENSKVSGLKVQIVDDDPDSRALMARILKRAGIVVSTADSAEDALEKVDGFDPDVIVSDIGMPGEDGYSFMRRLRARQGRQSKKTPAIALTAYVRDEDKRKAMAAGFQAHLAKPVDSAKLLDLIAELSPKA